MHRTLSSRVSASDMLCLVAGATCLLGGSPSCGSDCSGAPLLPLLYIAFNLGFNIAALNLLKTAGTVIDL